MEKTHTGFVYILTNPSFREDWVKIGKSARAVDVRSKELVKENFIEGMACSGGCIGGAGCLTHGEKNKTEVDKYGKEAYEKTISDAVSILKKN